MIDALQPFLEDKKQTLALDGGDLPPFRLEQDGAFKALFRLPDPQYKFVKKKTLAGKMLRPATIYSAVSRELLARKSQYRELAARTTQRTSRASRFSAPRAWTIPSPGRRRRSPSAWTR